MKVLNILSLCLVVSLSVAGCKKKEFEAAMGPAMGACQNNQKVSEAFSKLPG